MRYIPTTESDEHTYSCIIKEDLTLLQSGETISRMLDIERGHGDRLARYFQHTMYVENGAKNANSEVSTYTE